MHGGSLRPMPPYRSELEPCLAGTKMHQLDSLLLLDITLQHYNRRLDSVSANEDLVEGSKANNGEGSIDCDLHYGYLCLCGKLR